jgi:hypothetical protein
LSTISPVKVNGKPPFPTPNPFTNRSGFRYRPQNPTDLQRDNRPG